MELVSASGRSISDVSIRGVLNRLVWLHPRMFGQAGPRDREYASQELSALLLSTLYGLKAPVLNRPTPLGLSGQWRSASEWTVMAAAAGLPTNTVHLDSDRDEAPIPGAGEIGAVHRATVIGDHVLGMTDRPGFVDGCRRLAAGAGTRLLQISFQARGAAFVFVGASPLPDLSEGGPKLLDALALELGAGVGALA